jgi:type IV pilus assembly protein PilY1
MIADVNGSPGNPTNNNDFQRFFNEPEVAYYSRGGVTFLGILIGSGYRPSPLDNTIKDRFYMIKDFHAFTIPTSYNTITEGDLYDASSNDIQDGDADEQAAAASAIATSDGWFIDLLDESNNQKQKVFSEARIFESVILFSTYQEVSGEINTDVCAATSTQGQSHVYALSLIDGSAVLDLSNAVIDLETVEEGLEQGTITINSADRSIGLNIQGLPPTPVIVFPDPGTGEVTLSGRSAVAIVGLEAVFRFPDRFFPVNWEEIIDTGITPAQ